MRRHSKRATIRYAARRSAAYMHVQVTAATLALLETTTVSHMPARACPGTPQMIMYVPALLATNQS
jgi:hypothetical protein